MLQQILRQGHSRKQEQEQGEADHEERSQQLSDHLARTLHQEIKVCCDAACRYPSNYNAWSHRIWVLQHMAMGNIKVGQGIDSSFPLHGRASADCVHLWSVPNRHF